MTAQALVLLPIFILFAVRPGTAADDVFACFQPNTAAAARIAACGAAIAADSLPADTKALALTSRAGALAATDNAAAAIADYDAALAIVPDDVGALLARGILKETQEDYAGASADYSAALDRDGTLTEALRRRGGLRFISGNFANAADDYDSLNRAEAATPDNLLRLFVARARAGANDREALTAAAAALRARGWENSAWPMALVRYFLGEVSGDEALAAARAEDSADQGSRLCQAYFYLGQAGIMLRDPAEATRVFDALLALQAPCPFEKAAALADLARLRRAG